MSLWQRVFPKYGNWGGPGWSGGAYPKDPKDTDWSVAAIDSMDELFKKHDGSYQEAITLFRDGSIARGPMYALQEAADKVLVKEVGELSSNPKNWGEPAASSWYARVYRYLVLGSFYPKIWIF